MSNSGNQKSRLFHKGCVSVHTCQTAILSHVGALNSAYWAFPTFQSALIWAIALVVLSSFFIWRPVSTFACFRGRAFLGTQYSSPYVAKLNKSVWSETRMLSAIGYIQVVLWQFFCPSFARSFCRGNEHNGIDPNMSNSGHHKSRLFHKGCLSLHSCQTAILSHVGALNSAYWAFPTFQSAFIWAIALVDLSSSFIWNEPLG